MNADAEFADMQAGLLPAGTVTSFGVVVATSLTAYEMVGGRFVAFRLVHGVPMPVLPLVTFGGVL